MTFTDIVQDAAIAVLAATSIIQTFTIRRLMRQWQR